MACQKDTPEDPEPPVATFEGFEIDDEGVDRKSRVVGQQGKTPKFQFQWTFQSLSIQV